MLWKKEKAVKLEHDTILTQEIVNRAIKNLKDCYIATHGEEANEGLKDIIEEGLKCYFESGRAARRNK